MTSLHVLQLLRSSVGDILRVMELKTPVSVLQEHFVRQQLVPSYNLILNGGGTHEPVFKYEVSAGEHKAVGSGKSKKEAKHHAASNLLQLLSLESSDAQDITSPYEGVLKENVVGELQEFCGVNQLKLPEYKLTRDEGLSHAKIFTWACTVSTFITEGTAKTKKHAKQNAAQEMLIKLKQCLGDIIRTAPSESNPESSKTDRALSSIKNEENTGGEKKSDEKQEESRPTSTATKKRRITEDNDQQLLSKDFGLSDSCDEVYMYCQLLAKKLNKFDEGTREVLMREIDDLVFRKKSNGKRCVERVENVGSGCSSVVTSPCASYASSEETE